jgi:hypothetical protein
MKVKFCDKAILKAINKRALRNNYNRAIEEDFVDSLPDEMKFPVTFCMVHEHAAGQPVAPHMRCRIMVGKSLTGPFDYVFVDVEMGMFDLLPEVEIPDRESPQDTKSGIPGFSAN